MSLKIKHVRTKNYKKILWPQEADNLQRSIHLWIQEGESLTAWSIVSIHTGHDAADVLDYVF